METYTSEQILAMDDLYDLQDSFCTMGIPFKYEMTLRELEWLRFVDGKYSIVDWIDDGLKNAVILFDDPISMSQALDDDCGGAGKAVCLSDDTALQKLFFWLYSESIEED